MYAMILYENNFALINEKNLDQNTLKLLLTIYNNNNNAFVYYFVI